MIHMFAFGMPACLPACLHVWNKTHLQIVDMAAAAHHMILITWNVHARISCKLEVATDLACTVLEGSQAGGAMTNHGRTAATTCATLLCSPVLLSSREQVKSSWGPSARHPIFQVMYAIPEVK